ncbi:cobaltochelatase subunit CobN [Haloimpatiens sp. FM7315]|uniref:cobaltochelatase subunit CobN n=1 Tax=Haloimpatiens sp. FM7315 TaxID=3298609 RepID=UPI00370B17D0
MKITFITVSTPAIKNLINAGREIVLKFGQVLDLKLYNSIFNMDEDKVKLMQEDMKDSDFIFLDLMGSPVSLVKSVYEVLDDCNCNIVTYGNTAREYMRLGKFFMSSMEAKNKNKKINMETILKMQSAAETIGKIFPGKIRDMRNYSYIVKYFKVPDNYNVLNMLYLILKEYGKIFLVPKPKAPKEIKAVAICDPKTRKIYESFKELQKDNPFKKDRPTVVMLYYGHMYPVDTSKCVSKVKEQLEEFSNVLPIAVSGNFIKDIHKIKEIISEDTDNSIDLIINFMSFRLGAGPMGGDPKEGTDFLKEMNVPYIHPFFMTRTTCDSWKKSLQGCGSSEIMISVMLPEIDGVMESYAIGAIKDPEYNSDFHVLTCDLEIIDERLERLVSRIKRQISLRKKKNKDKKIAIIGYNYPPGEGNLFGGAFLDTFSSIENILKELKSKGYSVDSLDKDELIKLFSKGSIVNSGKYGSDMKNLIKYHNEKYKNDLQNRLDNEEILECWGEAPGTIMVNENKEFLIPGIINKNIFVGLQPSRGCNEDIEKSYHDKTMPPHYQYQAFYKWIKEEFKADAIVHVGTHGTLEFLKGKECGISGDCYSDILLEDIPHIYLYYCCNPSEATIAKRRSYANLVGYQPPVFVQSDLYGEYSKLKTLIDNYRQGLLINPTASRELLKNILLKAKNLNLPQDIEEIENELYKMKLSLIPKGLHTYGNKFTKTEALEYVKGVISYKISGVTSLESLVAEAMDKDINKLKGSKDYKTLDNIEKISEEILTYYLNNNELKKCEFINKNNKNKYIKTLKFTREIYDKSKDNYEINGLLKTLSGKYNEAKLSGDIYRNPNILPTGFNLYQFDPLKVPTENAYYRGDKICKNTIEAYRNENNRYPLSTAVILWGIETAKTQGETFCQILSYLGVKISEESNVWEPKFDIIPIKELGHPRIDVTINICGFFRDMFPNLIDNLTDIFNRIYDLDENDEENYFKANAKKIYKKLIKEGYCEKDAFDFSISRIFGPREGEYGTGITDLIDNKNWNSEREIGSLFLNNLQYVYNRNFRGREVRGLYEENLNTVDLISQIRSSNDYEIIDLDHYYEFFGGLSKSVELIKGSKVKMYIVDTTKSDLTVEKIDKSIARGVRTRLLNPKWINAMLNHKYHGGQSIYKRFKNIMGLAATTNSVDQFIYKEMYKTYVEDEKIRSELIKNNSYAYMDILEEFIEYYERGYFKAEDKEVHKIKKIYLEVEEGIEEEL